MVRIFLAGWLLMLAACSGASEPAPGSAQPVPELFDAGVVGLTTPVDASMPADAAVIATVSPSLDASPPHDAAPAKITAENRCVRDRQCVLDDVSCGRSCPGPREAINKRSYRQFKRLCKREERRRRRLERSGRKGSPSYSPCKRYSIEAMAQWPTHAVCNRGACVPAGSSGKTSSVTDEAVSELPERLTVSEVRARMSKIHKRVTACRKTLDKDGPKLLRLKLTIGPDGTISSAKPKQTGKLGTCIWTALSSETFPKTKHGVGFSYPFRRGD